MSPMERRKDYPEIMEKLDEMSKDIKTLNNLIIGNGKEAGLAEKVRGIEGVFNHVKAVWLAISGLIADFIFRTFFHHPKG